MYELLEAMASSNELLKQRYPERYERDRVVIDVITGASAGAMTAAILAQQLIYKGRELRLPYGNALYQAWVKQVDINKLLSVHPEQHKYSLLSTDIIDEIAAQFVQAAPGPSVDPHPTVDASLRVGIAMANLNGFPLSINGQSEAFSYSRYKDQFVCVIEREASPEGAELVRLREMEPIHVGGGVSWTPFPQPKADCSWSQLRMMALSSGAFPFAFRSRRINRVGGSSGGIMHSRDSQRKKDRGDSRRGGDYLYTDGGVFENEPVGMAAELSSQIDAKRALKQRKYLFVAPGKRSFSQDPLLHRDDDLLALATALMAAIFGQSRYQDWVTKGLDGELLTVTTSDVDLIGEVFSAFGGFLELDFRAYDYNIGRRTAREKLVQGRFRDLIGDYEEIKLKMLPIDWVEPDASRGMSRPSSALQDVGDVNDYGETARWLRKHGQLKPLAVGGTPSSEASGQRPDEALQQLRFLMANVSMEKRQLICTQIVSRVSSLIDYVNSDYLDPADQRVAGGWLRMTVRHLIGKPLTKLVLIRLFVRPFLRRNILRPDPS